MTNLDFGYSAGKPDFSYERSSVYARSFLILKKDQSEHYSPVGDYTVIDTEEDSSFTERKVINLISVMNGRGNLIDLGGQTKTRLLYHRKPKNNLQDKTQIVFYTLGEKGTSKENAILTLDEEED